MNKKQSFTSSLKGILPFLSPYKWNFIIAITAVIVSKILMTIAPMMEGNITTQLSLDVQNATTMGNIVISFDRITRILVILAGIYLCKMLAETMSVIYLTNAIQQTMFDLRNALQAKIRRLPVRYFDAHHMGDILSKITNDVDAISNAFQQSFVQVVGGIIAVVMALVFMFSISVKIALTAMLIIPGVLIITQFIVRRSQKRFQAQQDALGNLNSAITEMYTGYNEILLFNKQQYSRDSFRKLNDDLCKNAFKAQFISSIIQPLNSLVTYFTIAAVSVLGIIEVMSARIGIGDLQAFIRYIWQLNDPLTQVSSLSSQIQSAFAAMHRVVELLNEEEEIPEAHPAITLQKVQGNVDFKHVCFGYGDDDLMQDLHIKVKAGEMVAIVGPTGAGKTTLINLLLRFYDVKDGSICIDGVDIRDMERGKLRNLFGMVLQDTWLFNGTIYDNIRYGRLDARKDEVIQAAKLANVHHFIRTLPDGFHSFINEDANNVSQGEKQLLTIARAILKDPQILILDEATSSVDTRLEKMLQEAMQRVMKGRTSFVIAHRLSTIRNADLILVMQNGNIVEQGTHDSLMQKNGFYEKLYHAQFANQEE